MSQFFYVHPDNPQQRLLKQACDLIRQGEVIVYPTDSGYAIGCQLSDKQALERIIRIRDIDQHHNFTLMCRDMSELSVYSKVDNAAFRQIKNNTPGPYTFILKATNEGVRDIGHLSALTRVHDAQRLRIETHVNNCYGLETFINTASMC